jgi:hypothetical protein
MKMFNYETIMFAHIDCREGDPVDFMVKSTEKNLVLCVQATKEYLDGIVALQKQIREKYEPQFEKEGRELDWKEYSDKEELDVRGAMWSKDEYKNLFYT